MGYVDSQLLPGEAVLHRSKLHWRIFLFPGVFAALFVIAALAAFLAKLWALGLLSLLAAAPFVIVPFAKRASSEFVVTNKRLVVKMGVVSTRTLELLLSKVEAIAVDQGLLGKLLGYGDITVTGSGGTREMFPAIEAPLELRRAVQAASTAAT